MSSLDNRIICKIFDYEMTDDIDIISLLLDIKYEQQEVYNEKCMAEKQVEIYEDYIDFLKEQIEYLRKRNG